MNPLLETWQINHRMNERLIAGIKEEYFPDVSISKGRTVGEHFAHIHNVRLMWLQTAAPLLMQGQAKVEKNSITRKMILEHLENSAEGITQLIQQGIATGKIKGFKPHTEAFLGYIIAHESHHRGQILMVLKENKHLPDKKTLYSLWEWGTAFK